MKLSKKLAQKIVEEMMQVIPYNVNVMNEKGMIIGSGEKNRIGKIHEGAIEAIQKKQMIEVYEIGKGTKPGVNEPILINEEAIGVVGITGEPEKVRPFSKLVRVTTILLIEQERRLKEDQEKEKQMEEFLYEWAYRKKEYDKEFYSLAKDYGINLDHNYQAVILIVQNTENFEKEIKKIIPESTYFLRLDAQRFVLFLEENDHVQIELFKDKKEVKKIGIGHFSKPFSNSLEQAVLAIEIGEKINPSKRAYLYKEWEFLIELSHRDKKKSTDLIQNLEKTGEKVELIKTLQIYIEENGEMNEIAKKLNIHRNTLNYRLEKIYEITGKHPKKFLDLMELISGIVWKS